MRGFITDSTACGRLRLTDGLPEPDPAADEVVVEVRAHAVSVLAAEPFAVIFGPSAPDNGLRKGD
ncbi:hypothetical protein ACQP0C_34795 [Nocardia sp. CA-129566]|uniref:hypothetical protein n=1 Tax=Nocardia sp. CA-129566 TaxID=3239976 RepID=UPI003D99F2F0